MLEKKARGRFSSSSSRGSSAASMASVRVMVGDAPGSARLMTGRPPAERQSGASSPPSRSPSYCMPVQSVGFGGAAGMPPKVAQVPTATTKRAFCARARAMSRLGRPR